MYTDTIFKKCMLKFTNVVNTVKVFIKLVNVIQIVAERICISYFQPIRLSDVIFLGIVPAKFKTPSSRAAFIFSLFFSGLRDERTRFCQRTFPFFSGHLEHGGLFAPLLVFLFLTNPSASTDTFSFVGLEYPFFSYCEFLLSQFFINVCLSLQGTFQRSREITWHILLTVFNKRPQETLLFVHVYLLSNITRPDPTSGHYVKRELNFMMGWLRPPSVKRIIIIIIIIFLDNNSSSSCIGSTELHDLFLPTRPYRPSLLVSPLHSIQYPHRADRCRSSIVCPCADTHWRTSLMSLSLLLQQCPACLVRLTRMVYVI